MNHVVRYVRVQERIEDLKAAHTGSASGKSPSNSA